MSPGCFRHCPQSFPEFYTLTCDFICCSRDNVVQSLTTNRQWSLLCQFAKSVWWGGIWLHAYNFKAYEMEVNSQLQTPRKKRAEETRVCWSYFVSSISSLHPRTSWRGKKRRIPNTCLLKSVRTSFPLRLTLQVVICFVFPSELCCGLASCADEKWCMGVEKQGS